MSQCWKQTGKNPIKTGWADTNKGTSECPNIRSRWVAQECNTRPRPHLFSATTHQEGVKLVISEVASSNQKGTVLLVIDVRRAYIYAKARRRVYVELPEGDGGGPGNRQCGLLRKSLYGTLDAAQNWECELGGFLEKIGLRRGQASTCLYSEEARRISASVHGVKASREEAEWPIRSSKRCPLASEVRGPACLWTPRSLPSRWRFLPEVACEQKGDPTERQAAAETRCRAAARLSSASIPPLGNGTASSSSASLWLEGLASGGGPGVAGAGAGVTQGLAMAANSCWRLSGPAGDGSVGAPSQVGARRCHAWPDWAAALGFSSDAKVVCAQVSMLAARRMTLGSPRCAASSRISAMSRSASRPGPQRLCLCPAPQSPRPRECDCGGARLS